MPLLILMVIGVVCPLMAHVTIKPIAIVKQDKIIVSDLFDGLDAEDLRVVRDAPLPGKRIVLDYKQIQGIAQKVGVSWEPLTHQSRIVVKRDAYKMPSQQLHQLIKDALMASHDELFEDDKTDIVLDRSNPAVYLPKEKECDVQVVDLELSERKNHFTATIKTPYETYTINGSLEKMIEVPVLKTVMKRGDVITENNLETIRIPLKEIGRATITELPKIVGHRIRNGQCPAFQPLYEHQLEVVHQVPKGSLVTMIVHVNGVEITGRGKALENGQLNDVIRVENIDSKRIVLGQVTGPKTVDVQGLANQSQQGVLL